MKSYVRLKLFLLFTFMFAMNVSAQDNHRFSVSISAGTSKTGSLRYSDSYTKFSISPTFNILKTSLSSNNNYNFSIGYQPIKSISLNGSIGVASYGFTYTADVIASPTNMASIGGFVAKDEFYSRQMEVGFSVMYRIQINNDITFILQPGIAWYTNQRENSQQILSIYLNSNNFSTTFFTGIEIPIKNNNFYTSIGLITKMALNNFAFDINENEFLPFGAGIQAAVSYRFGSFKNQK